ncbi:hydroxyacid dehydrogenase [Amylibacter kogurei]|uniref:Hydroxyacid dehydrogenase n=1 Tax=Paramylibacter kogurei TaxID=1889778 RepID=A0A2G5K3R0_9RHOB|nr:FAD-binding oxidoreductase [Amylibacter kogurei]PIB24177.1 hydroxyacid dehydrogenase [Amylibacter kogurei]
MAEDIFGQLLDEFGAGVVEHAAQSYLEEPRGTYQSAPMPLIRPHDTQGVSDVVAFCHRHNIAIIPYGGGTGLVGGQTKPDGNAVILSIERLNKIRDIFPTENVIVVEAGMFLADVQAAADSNNRLFPLSLASEGSCRIGGNLATNAGGTQVLRYGNARDLCLGIEAVLPDGTIHHGLRRLRKDNTGYDLRNLLIGSEGSLGIITAAALKLFPKPQETTTALLAVSNVDAAVQLLGMVQDQTGGLVSGFELMHRNGFEFLTETMPTLRQAFDTPPEWSVLLEVSGGADFNLDERVMNVLETAMETELVLDALLAQSQSQRDEFWNLRETIPEANRLIGAISSHDISVPISRIPEFIANTPALLAQFGDIRINCFGHLGDGNLHYNVYPPKGGQKKDFTHLRDDIQRTVHDQVQKFDGSMSAEHGIGRLKVADLETYGDPAKLAAMRAIKFALDPKGIMNPGAVLRND